MKHTKKALEDKYSIVISGKSGNYSVNGFTYKTLDLIDTDFKNQVLRTLDTDSLSFVSELFNLNSDINPPNLITNQVISNPVTDTEKNIDNDYKNVSSFNEIYDIAKKEDTQLSKEDTQLSTIAITYKINKKVITNEDQIIELNNLISHYFSYEKFMTLEHNVISVDFTEKINVLRVNEYENRNKTEMKKAQFKSADKFKSNTHDVLLRLEQTSINFSHEGILSIYSYNTENKKLYCHYSKIEDTIKTKNSNHLEKKLSSKVNQQIAFTGYQSSKYVDKYGINYNLKFNTSVISSKTLDLYIDDILMGNVALWDYKALKEYQCTYNFNGNVNIDHDKGLTQNKIKSFLNDQGTYKPNSILKMLNNDPLIQNVEVDYQDTTKQVIKYLNVIYKNGNSIFRYGIADDTKITLSPLDISYTDKKFNDFIAIAINNLKNKIDDTDTAKKDYEKQKEDIDQKINLLRPQISTYNCAIHKIENAIDTIKKVKLQFTEKSNYTFLRTHKITNLTILNILLLAYPSLVKCIKYYFNQHLSKLENKLYNLKNANCLKQYKEYIIQKENIDKCILELKVKKESYKKKKLEYLNTSYHEPLEHLLKSVMNKSINKRLSKLLGTEYLGNYQHFTVNKKEQFKGNDNKIIKRSASQSKRLLRNKIAHLLSEQGFIYGDFKYQIVYNHHDKWLNASINDLILRLSFDETSIQTGNYKLLDHTLSPNEYCNSNNDYLSKFKLRMIFTSKDII